MKLKDMDYSVPNAIFEFFAKTIIGFFIVIAAIMCYMFVAAICDFGIPKLLLIITGSYGLFEVFIVIALAITSFIADYNENHFEFIDD